MTTKECASVHERWALFRFSVVGPLLACPPQKGQLADRLRELASLEWKHPINQEPLTLGFSTIERWFSMARKAHNPVSELRNKKRSDSGRTSVCSSLAQAIMKQYCEHKGWSYQLHFDNLAALVCQSPEVGVLPSYSTVLRHMKSHALIKMRRSEVKREKKLGKAASSRGGPREVRSYEVEYVHALWHLDFHEGSRNVLCQDGQYRKPQLLGVLDDRSRLCCHLQWYLEETAEALIHGLSQAFLKRGLPRALMTDNGSAMRAAETVEGLGRLSILPERTLEYSPHQNGKQEVFWGQIEGRLLPMLEGQQPLTLGFLNEATQAWVEGEYNCTTHSELNGQSPSHVVLKGKGVERECKSMQALREAFTMKVSRKQRLSDGTLTVDGVRFELPSAYRHIRQLHVRYARWDLSRVWLHDEITDTLGQPLYPLDKQKNAEQPRAVITIEAPATEPTELPPLMKKLLCDYARTGLPPAYIPHVSKHDQQAHSESADE